MHMCMCIGNCKRLIIGNSAVTARCKHRNTVKPHSIKVSVIQLTMHCKRIWGYCEPYPAPRHPDITRVLL